MSTKTLEDFIKDTVIDEIGIMVYTPRLKYLSFFVMSSAIEFLGACLDKEDFHKKGISGTRFKKAINELNSFGRYRSFIGSGSGVDLYAELRCGLLHAGLPQSHIELTEHADRVCGRMHLQRVTLGGRITNPRLILVCEDLYCDICGATKEVIAKMKANKGKNYKKADMPFLATDILIVGTP